MEEEEEQEKEWKNEPPSAGYHHDWFDLVPQVV